MSSGDGRSNSDSVAGATPTKSAATNGLLLGTFLVSLATLHLEILQTRIFAVVLWHHVLYLVVTFTLLGFAAGGTILSLLPDAVERAPRKFLAGGALLFSISAVGAFELLARGRLDTMKLLEQRSQYLWVFAYYIYLVVPYLLAGLTIGAALRLAGPRTGTVYGVNLVGSAVGCLVFTLLLRPLGGAASMFVAAACAAASASAFVGGLLRAVSLAFTLALLVPAVPPLARALHVPDADRLLPIEVAPSKPLAGVMAIEQAAGRPARVEERRWDPICRVDVVDPGQPGAARRVYQDGDAPTEIFPSAARFDPFSIYALPYFVTHAGRVARHVEGGPSVLVIGVGGGQDLRQAVWNGARKVTGAEINASTISLMRNEYAQFSGDVYTMPGVEVNLAEGRSFVRRSAEKFDLIQMTGTDTYTALASGSYVLSESYLYTLDAFQDYFEHLQPGGCVSILRFRFFPPRESLRLVAIGVEALKRRGVAHPENHVLVVDFVNPLPRRDASTPPEKLAYASILFKESPIVPEEIAAAKQWIAINPRNFQRGANPIYSLAYAPCEPVVNEFGEYLAAVAAGKDADYRAGYRYLLDPVSDDSPFFFKYHRWKSLLEPQSATDYFSMTGRDPIGLFLLLTALLESTLLVVLLVLLPLWLSRRTRLPRERRGPVLLYFVGIGCGYLFLEVAAMQRFVLYLGHPTRSITVVLFSFLVFSGIGAFVAGRRRSSSPRGPLLAVVAITLLYAFAQPWILDRTLGLATSARILVAGALLAPLAFCMGMPFPIALARLHGSDRAYVPWSLAINGGASVVASVVAILVAMSSGFTTVFLAAGGAYLLALAASGALPAGTGSRSEPDLARPTSGR